MEKNTPVGITVTAFYIASCFYLATASDPSPLQDFSVAVPHPNSALFLNGEFCKDPKHVTADDFLYKGFNESANITSVQNAAANLVSVKKFPALNTLGLSIARVDFGPLGLNTPHWYRRGSEAFAVMKGQLYAGFVTTVSVCCI